LHSSKAVESLALVNAWVYKLGRFTTLDIPGLVNIQKAIENGHRNSGFVHEKWPFSIAILT
jgi:hypothetical protein